MPPNTFASINEKCGTTNNMTALSIFSVTVSTGIALTAIPLNFLIITCILKERKKKFNIFFFKLVLTIAVADFLTGIVSVSTSINFHTKEAKQQKIGIIDIYMLHLSVFYTDAVALITMTLLCIDRLIALACPIRYYKGMKGRSENVIVFAVWPLAVAFVSPYFKVHFIRQLAIFTILNVSLAVVAMVITIVVYKTKYLKKLEKKCQTTNRDNSGMSINSTETGVGIITNPQVTNIKSGNECYSNLMNLSENNLPRDNENATTVTDTNENKKKRKSSSFSFFSCGCCFKQSKTKGKMVELPASRVSMQKKATKTFLYMLLVFVLTYLPTCVMMVYMNVCMSCNCIVVHSMRDLSILSILSSSVFRPLNFIFGLHNLKNSARRLFKRKNNEKGSTTEEFSLPSKDK